MSQHNGSDDRQADRIADKPGRRAALRTGLVMGAATASALALGQRQASAATNPNVTTDPLTNNTCITPSGDTTGATDTANINGALATNLNGQNVVLAAGHFYVNSTIMIPPGGMLRGQFANEVDVPTNHAWGSVLSAVSPWTNAVVHSGTANATPITAVLACVGKNAGGYAAPGDESKIYGIAIDCSGITTAGVDGLQIFGDMSRPHLERVLVANAPGNGVNMVNYTDTTTTPPTVYGPDAAHFDRVNAWAAGGDGFHHIKISDCTYIDCLAEQCGGSGFYVENGSNGVWIGCRAEHNLVNGYYYTCSSVGPGSGVARFTGCSSDRNSNHGIYITTNGSPSNALPLVLSACQFRRDGSSGGVDFAGITVSGYPGPVQISGCTVWPGVGDNGSGPASPNHGIRLVNNADAVNAQVVIAASYIQGNGDFLSDDGSTLDVRWGPDVVGAYGATNGPPTIRGPRMGTATLSGGTKTVKSKCVTATSIIQVTKTGGGSSGVLGVTNLVTGVSFDVTSSSATDSSSFSWQIMNP